MNVEEDQLSILVVNFTGSLEVMVSVDKFTGNRGGNQGYARRTDPVVEAAMSLKQCTGQTYFYYAFRVSLFLGGIARIVCNVRDSCCPQPYVN